jgi:menaquinone-dependent protoporphyrinogen oxidase
MRTRRILIVYGTRYGQTAKVAEHMRAILTADGFDVTVADAAAPSTDPDLAHFDGVLVGGSVIRGRHQRAIRRFVIRHLARLNVLPSAFFSVSGSAGSAEPRGPADARAALQRFLTETHWDPDMMTTVAGAIAYTKYPLLLRWVLREISRRAGGPTDMSRDHELTDWEQVAEFAHRFGHIVAPVSFQRAVRANESERELQPKP